MDKTAQKEFAVTKVLARADKWYDARTQTQLFKHGPQQDRLRALGRYEVAGDLLAESVEKLRKTDTPEVNHG